MYTTLRQAFRLIGRGQRRRWILLIALALIASAFEMLGALLVYVLLALVVDPSGDVDLPLVGDVRQLAAGVDEQALLLAMLVTMGVFFAMRAIVQVAVTYIQQRVAQNTGARLSNRLVAGYLNWPYAAHLHRNSSELIRNGHQAVKEFVTQVFLPLIRVTAESIMVLAMLALLISIAPAATGMAVLLIGGGAVVLLFLVQPRIKKLGAISHATSKETLGAMQQALHGVRDIKLLGREKYFARRYAQSRLRYARANYLNATLANIPHAVMELVLLIFILLFFAIAVGAGTPSQNALSILGLFAYAGLRLQPSLQRITSGLNSIKYATAPLVDLHSDLISVEQTPAEDSAVEALPFTDAIVVDNVSFQYAGAAQNALTSINLTIKKGQVVGICGPTGGGKTTLVDLITGLLTPTSGRITIDGTDLQQKTRQWQRSLGVVSQSVFLIDDTLRRNIALGVPDEKIDDDAVSRAVQLAQLTDFINSLPEGIETTVGERGVRLSGGQRQRIAIARALYSQPAVLVFDEGTSALDNATEASLMASIEQLRGSITVIHIAHRISTVKSSDQVILVERGRISAVGTYDELRRDNVGFQQLSGAYTGSSA